MNSRSWTIALLTTYSLVATVMISRNFVRDVLVVIKKGSEIGGSANYDYEEDVLTWAARRSSFASSSRPSNDGNSIPTFPIKTHIVTYGSPRTATTLLFNMVAVSYFLYLTENNPGKIADVELKFWIRPDAYITLRKRETPMVVKTHLSLDNFLSGNVVVFTAATNRKKAAKMKATLERDGHTVAYVQDMETLKESGIAQLVDAYVTGYGLSKKDREILNEYFSLWEVLRQCCGQQMSMRWRNDMMPEKFKDKNLKSHPTCGSYDIDMIERSFMETELYSLIEKYPSVQPLNKPSLKDENLNGTYCSSYNYLVRTQGLSFWGQPGGRPVRSKLDGAIKEQFKLGLAGLKESAHPLLNITQPLNEVLKELWHRPEEEKKLWLKAVLAAREGGKRYEDYGIEPENSAGENDDVGVVVEDSDGSVGAAAADIEDRQEIGDLSGKLSKEERASENAEDQSLNRLDGTHAIFLISFEAAESTLVERCILSLRRRGAWNGYVILLTDAPPERYQNEWDDNVIVMHPLDKHLNAADGTPLTFTKDNRSLKSKRFKTFIIEYMSMDKRLDSVQLIYYLDIDIMAGDSMHSLFSNLERKYNVSQETREGGLSKLYFFTPISDEWPLQGGTFIVERKSSAHCLALWRREIDNMTVSGRGRDQDGLRNIYQRIQYGEEDKCELVRMENEQFISFPIPRTFKRMRRESSFPILIHISNSVFAKWIDEKQQTEYIHKVLQLSEEEKQSGKYGTIVIQPRKSDME
ncbi:hypothetical protein ACHAXH_006250 [Discostella pseudostelligera]